MRAPRGLPVAALALVLALWLAACGAAGSEGGEPRGEIVVAAAASLSDAFADIATLFEEERPGVSVLLNVAGTQRLAQQIRAGAPADVLASADERHMDALAGDGLVAGDPSAFASNRLAIAVEAGNPLGIGGLAGLAGPGALVVLPAPEVPAGRYARAALALAGVAARPASLEDSSRGALAKVVLGEADATVTYVTDVAAAGGAVEAVAFPEAEEVEISYPIAVLSGARRPGDARAFVALVLSERGQAVLRAHGFGAP